MSAPPQHTYLFTYLILGPLRVACGITFPTRVATHTPQQWRCGVSTTGLPASPKDSVFQSPRYTLQSKSKDSHYNYKIVGVSHYHIIYSVIYIIELIIQLLLENSCLEKNVIVNYRNVAHFAQYQESYCSHIY